MLPNNPITRVLSGAMGLASMALRSLESSLGVSVAWGHPPRHGDAGQAAGQSAPKPVEVPALFHSSPWQYLLPHLKIQTYDRDGSARNPRKRIELDSISAGMELVREALELQVACVSCGAPHHPFRRRKGKGHSDTIYLAVACSPRVKAACSRGKAASAAYLDIIAAREGCTTQSRQQELQW